MRKFTHLFRTLTVALLIVLSIQPVQAAWTVKAGFPIFPPGRWGIQMVNLDGKIYAGGGYEGSNSVGNEWVEYDPTTNTWTSKKQMPGTASNRAGGIAFNINGKAYIGLGIENFNSFQHPWTYLTDLWQYDPTNDTWTEKASFPGAGVGFSGFFIANNKAYVVGGMINKGGDATNKVYEYDPATDKWTAKADFPEEISNQPFGFSLNGKGYISGGSITGGSSDKTYEYNPTSDKWTQKQSYPYAVYGGVSFVAGDRAYCGLGSKGVGDYPEIFYAYDASSDSWSYAGGLETTSNFVGRNYAQTEVIDGKAYLLAGWKFIDGNQQWFKDLHEIDLGTALNISNIENDKTLEIYPNPASNVLAFKSEQTYDTYQLYNITGQVVLSGNVKTVNSINVSALSSGQYILYLKGASSSAHRAVTIK